MCVHVLIVCISIYLYDFRYFRLFEFRKIVSNRELCYKLIPPDYPVEITKVTITMNNQLSPHYNSSLRKIINDQKNPICNFEINNLIGRANI